jgi:hypothetical protein
MMSWKIFEKDSPELAALGFEKLNRKIVYLATIKRDGSPRLHPVTPAIGNGMLFMFTEPSSPKIQDLKRDGRYAMHCAIGHDGILFEFLVCGCANLISDPAARAQAEKIMAPSIAIDNYVLFDFQIESVLVVEYDEHKKKVIRRWQRKKDV